MRRFLNRRTAIAALGLASLAAISLVSAEAAEDSVLQIKQSFEPGEIEVAAGTTVTFLNGDDVNHNLQTIAPGGGKTDQGLEKPGEKTEITFPTAGVYTVMCGIHPRMHMKVTAH